MKMQSKKVLHGFPWYKVKVAKKNEIESGMYLMMCFYNTMDPYMEQRGVILRTFNVLCYTRYYEIILQGLQSFPFMYNSQQPTSCTRRYYSKILWINFFKLHTTSNVLCGPTPNQSFFHVRKIKIKSEYFVMIFFSLEKITTFWEKMVKFL